ncbi:MAG: ABC transporter ATP-binding protein, partial [Gammaproteobacteria bacterium]|nr:ABC transporter ATP-binding protein [Gammaproteobacteria bacterium]
MPSVGAESATGSSRYGWSYLLAVARQHRRTLIIAHVIAVAAVLSAIPIPLLMPLLVDEVLLARPGIVVATLDGIFPGPWHGPLLYVCAILALTVLLRLTALAFTALQVR